MVTGGELLFAVDGTSALDTEHKGRAQMIFRLAQQLGCLWNVLLKNISIAMDQVYEPPPEQ